MKAGGDRTDLGTEMTKMHEIKNEKGENSPDITGNLVIMPLTVD